MVSARKQIKNYIDYADKPFTSGMIRDDLQINFILVKRIIATMVQSRYIKAVSKTGKFKIYVKNPEFKEDNIRNKYGYNYQTISEIIKLIKQNNIKSSRQLHNITNHSRGSIRRYLTALLSGGYIAFNDNHFIVTKKRLISDLVGKEYHDGILSECKRRSND